MDGAYWQCFIHHITESNSSDLISSISNLNLSLQFKRLLPAALSISLSTRRFACISIESYLNMQTQVISDRNSLVPQTDKHGSPPDRITIIIKSAHQYMTMWIFRRSMSAHSVEWKNVRVLNTHSHTKSHLLPPLPPKMIPSSLVALSGRHDTSEGDFLHGRCKEAIWTAEAPWAPFPGLTLGWLPSFPSCN